jgi:hypothetical protein
MIYAGVHRRDAEDAEMAQRVEVDSILRHLLCALCVSAVNAGHFIFKNE